MLTEKEEDSSFGNQLKYIFTNIWRVIPVTVIILALIKWSPGVLLFLCILIAPFLLLLSFPGSYEKKKLFTGIGRGFSIGGKSWGTGLGIFVIFLFIMGIIFFFGMTYPEMLIKMFLDWFLIPSTDNYFLIMNIIDASIYMIILNLIVPFFYIAFAVLYFSTVEKEEAYGMFERLKKFGTGSKIYESPEEGEY